MTKTQKISIQTTINNAGATPSLSILKIGIVSRDYNKRYPNRYRDFSQILADVLALLDKNGCDSALFSLFSIISRKSFDPRTAFKGLQNIKAIFLEEFQDEKSRKAGRYVIYYRAKSDWKEYAFNQIFGSITGMSLQDIEDFVMEEMPKRIIGNCCVLLCGEINGVKYSRSDKRVHDDFGLRAAIRQKVNIVLNPIHDRMTRFEMKLKRQFLSQNGRWVISVWNKGKQDKNGKVKDGNNPAWTVFHNGNKITVQRVQNKFGSEIGVLDIRGA
jgi:hypothetical protein